jgi:hypothetical protein
VGGWVGAHELFQMPQGRLHGEPNPLLSLLPFPSPPTVPPPHPHPQDTFRNLGGFHMLGSGRDKIEKPEQLAAAAKSCKELSLDGLMVIGGDDSNTNAAVLAEYFIANGGWLGWVGWLDWVGRGGGSAPA